MERVADSVQLQMDPGRRRALRGARLVPGLFECGLLLCWGTVPLSTLAVSGIVGESALLSCVNSDVGKRADDEIRVYWQTADHFVHAFYSGQEQTNQSYGNRAKLFTEEFKQGNFSLLLSDLQVSDDADYTCIIQMKQPILGYTVVLSIVVTLQVSVPLSTLAVSGIVGESALLSCVNSDVGKRADDEIRVYWQTADHFVHAFYSGQEQTNQSYGNRAKLFTEEFKQGNFSLLLSDLQVSDDADYTCIIQMKQPILGYTVVLSIVVTLQVSAHYTEPVLTVEPKQTDLGHGELVKLICSSWGGYPEPTVHWTNSITDILDGNRTVVNHINCSRKELCNVTSILWIQATSHSITCSIYNAKLQENKTATLFWNLPKVNPVSELRHKWVTPVVLVALIIVVSLAIYVFLKYFPRSLLTGDVAAQQFELASLKLTDPVV
ncbi:CD276 antigen-like isoform X2 [Heterodontus francisci]|uniref:CD276 antigen-like isoform X2 n=1 Tax=Heterodontus francisci TaxID=7792 RepID=UPI00355B77FD